MKRIITLLTALLLASAAPRAQEAELQRAARRYKDARTLTADVVRTQHNAALAADAVTRGKFYYQKPGRLSMVFASAKEMLLAADGTFAMVKDGRVHAARTGAGKGSSPLAAVGAALKTVLSGEEDDSLKDLADVWMEKEGSVLTLTVAPAQASGKAGRRAAFTSCVLTLDLKAAEIRSLRVNERGENYTRYDFSGYRFDAALPADAFDTGSVL